MKSALWRLRVHSSEMAFLKFILEGYDGIVTMRILDLSDGVIGLYVPPGCDKVVSALLQRLESEVEVSPLQAAGNLHRKKF